MMKQYKMKEEIVLEGEAHRLDTIQSAVGKTKGQVWIVRSLMKHLD